jgi:drug/metabolite transporter (DMT)-like permease
MAIVIPVVALAISAALEGWRPTLWSAAGIALGLVAVWVAQRPEPAAA